MKRNSHNNFLKKSFFMRASFVSSSLHNYELTDLQLSLPEEVSGASWISCSPQSLHDRLSLKLSWQPKRNPKPLTSSYWAWVRATSYDYDDESFFNKNIAKMAGNSTPAAKWRQRYKPLIFCLVRYFDWFSAGWSARCFDFWGFERPKRNQNRHVRRCCGTLIVL